MFMWVLRALLSLVLGLAVFLALAVFLVFSGVQGALSADIYIDALNQSNVYERIYSEALTPEAINGIRPELADPLNLLTGEELAALARTVAPPHYLKSQVEGELRQLDAYLSGETDTLTLYINLAQPMDRIVPAIKDVVEARIMGASWQLAPGNPAGADQASSASAQALAAEAQLFLGDQYSVEIATALESLMAGESPSSTVSDLTGLPRDDVLATFDRSFDAVLASPALEPKYRDSLEEARPGLRTVFSSGDTPELLSEALKAAAGPAIDRALAGTRAGLDAEGRINLVPLLATGIAGTDEAHLQRSLKQYRDDARSLLLWGKVLPLVAIGLSAALAAALFRGRWDSFLRWTYLTLAIAGGAAFAIALAAYLLLPGVIERAVLDSLAELGGYLPGLPPLVSDAAGALVATILGQLLWIAGIPVVAGLALWLATKAVRIYKLRTDRPRPGGKGNGSGEGQGAGAEPIAGSPGNGDSPAETRPP